MRLLGRIQKDSMFLGEAVQRFVFYSLSEYNTLHPLSNFNNIYAQFSEDMVTLVNELKPAHIR